MADQASPLLKALEDTLNVQAPLTGGWLLTRIKEPEYPFGTIDLLGSDPVRGQAYYSETHDIVLSVWTRAKEGQTLHPKEALALSRQAFEYLETNKLYAEGLNVTRLVCGRMTPQSPDLATIGRSFIVTAITHEVENG